MRVKLLLLLLAVLLLWWFSTDRQRPVREGQAGCLQPLTYRLDSIDSAFALSRTDAQQQIDAAAEQWNQAVGYPVLQHDAATGFPIRFVYDERQQRLLEQALLQRNVQRYDQRISEQQQDFAARLADFEQRQQQFAAQDRRLANEIAQFNQRVRQAGNQAAAQLGREQAELLSRQKEHALQAEQLEAERDKLQSQQQLINDTIDNRNSLLPPHHSAGTLAEVGVLEQQGQQRRMTIFAYKDQPSLQLTLLHEFGHALGIGHLPQPEAVMHAALSGQQQQLTAADIAALKPVCQQ